MIENEKRLLVISPHLDDAVLGCGSWLAAHPGAVVCTVFAGTPAQNMSTDWDRTSGFADAFEAMQARKAEDSEALRILGARPMHLPFCDAQYHSSPSHDELVAALAQAITEIKPAIVLIPLGLFHSDHQLVADACLAVVPRLHGFAVRAYEDVPYRRIDGSVQTCLRDLAQRGYTASPDDLLNAEPGEDHQKMKRRAIAAYRSQLRAFGPEGQAGLFSPERFWRFEHLG